MNNEFDKWEESDEILNYSGEDSVAKICIEMNNRGSENVFGTWVELKSIIVDKDHFMNMFITFLDLYLQNQDNPEVINMDSFKS